MRKVMTTCGSAGALSRRMWLYFIGMSLGMSLGISLGIGEGGVGWATEWDFSPNNQGNIPNFSDPHYKIDLPSLEGKGPLRFLTSDDYPPFHFKGPEDRLIGFNVELARHLCGILQHACHLQSRPWSSLVDRLLKGEGDVIVASLRLTPAHQAQMEMTAPYYRTPARFVVRQESRVQELSSDTLKAWIVGVQSQTAHEAYMKDFFPEVKLKTYENLTALYQALKTGEVEIIFADGLTSALWMASPDSQNCCQFKGGFFGESFYFGEGASLGVRKGETSLRQALDYALKKISEKGLYTELYLKYFPIGFY